MRVSLQTERLTLEPVTPEHFVDLWEIYRDKSLHAYIPRQSMTYEESLDRFERWTRGVSSAGKIIMNWAGRHRNGEIVGHYQIQLEPEQTATVGYIIRKSNHRQGYAFEGLRKIFEFITSNYPIKSIQASIDARNEASINLAKKLGMEQTELNRNANVSKDGTSDECVFTLVTEQVNWETTTKELQL